MTLFSRCLVLDEADRLLDMGYEKDVAAIVKAIEDHKKAATYDPIALMKQSVKKKIVSDDDSEESEGKVTADITDVKHGITEVMLSKRQQTVLLSATLTKVSGIYTMWVDDVVSSYMMYRRTFGDHKKNGQDAHAICRIFMFKLFYQFLRQWKI